MQFGIKRIVALHACAHGVMHRARCAALWVLAPASCLAGRYEMKRGIKERFGDDIVERLERLGQIKLSAKSSEGASIPFMLTKAVSARMHSPTCADAPARARRCAALPASGGVCMQGRAVSDLCDVAPWAW